jgi:glycosyltransferase involved in cell wall biosynthesis
MPTKVCYVLPLYDENTHQHHAYLYPFIEDAAKRLRMLVIVEKTTGKVRLSTVERIWVQYFRLAPLRAIELFVLLLVARLMGYKTFYTHYSFYGSVAAGFIARLTGGRSFYWSCGELAVHHVRPTSLANIRRIITRQWPEKLAIRMAKPLVTGTMRMADYYALHYGVNRYNIRVMPNWVGPERFERAEPDAEIKAKIDAAGRGPRVLFVHRLAPLRGATWLAPLLERAAKEYPEVVFVVAGDGPSRRDVEEDARKRGLESRLVILGWIPNRLVPGLMKMSDVLIMPSRHEAFGRILLEAMAAGLPFVATDCGGIPDVLTAEQAEFMSGRDDLDRFGANMMRLLGDATKRETLRQVGLKHVRNYATEVVLDQFVKMLEAR